MCTVHRHNKKGSTRWPRKSHLHIFLKKIKIHFNFLSFRKKQHHPKEEQRNRRQKERNPTRRRTHHRANKGGGIVPLYLWVLPSFPSFGWAVFSSPSFGWLLSSLLLRVELCSSLPSLEMGCLSRLLCWVVLICLLLHLLLGGGAFPPLAFGLVLLFFFFGEAAQRRGSIGRMPCSPTRKERGVESSATRKELPTTRW